MRPWFRLSAVVIVVCLCAASEGQTQDKSLSRFEFRRKAALLISDPAKKSEGLLAIAREAAEKGVVNEVGICLVGVAEPGKYADKIGGVLGILVGLGYEDDALKLAQNINDEKARDVVLEIMARGPTDGPALLWKICIDGNAAELNGVLSNATANAKDGKGETGLMKAAARGHVAVVQKLMPLSELWETDAQGQTAFIKAAANGQEAVLRALVSPYLQEDPNAKEYPGSAPVNIADKQGKTALILATANGHAGTVDLLLKMKHTSGASFGGVWHRLTWHPKLTGMPAVDVSRRDNSGKSALDYARDNGHASVVGLLDSKK